MKRHNSPLLILAFLFGVVASLPAHTGMTLEPGTSVTFHHHDLLGSPVMVSDHQGRVLWFEKTTPYGQSLGRLSATGTGHLDNTVGEATSRPGHTGHTVDSTTGLVYMKARHYDPVIGRFYSNDPVGFSASSPMLFNRYAYANNNPYTYTDPDGRQSQDIMHSGPTIPGQFWGGGGGGISPRAVVNALGLTGTAAVIQQRAERMYNESSSDNIPDSDPAGKQSTLEPGPHAGESIPVDGPGRATAQQQADINAIGNESGCHTCGTDDPGTMHGDWVLDHQPPSALNPPGGEQRGYPHCIDCMRQQGGKVNAERARQKREEAERSASSSEGTQE